MRRARCSQTTAGYGMVHSLTTMIRHTILLVEDNSDDELLTLEALNPYRSHSDMVVARDGAEALDYLFPRVDRPPVPPVVILLDLKLPRVAGLDVLRRVRAEERTRLCPVVILSSSVETRDVQESYRLGTNSYVRKPVEYTSFAEALRQLGAYWLSLNESPYGRGHTRPR